MNYIQRKLQFARCNHLFLALASLVFIQLLAIDNAQALVPQQQQLVQKVINAFKHNDRVRLSKMVSYPLLRQAPLGPINNPKAFLKRYDEVFDKYILDSISTSLASKDWSSIGWQGVILDDGIVALDPDGHITEINYQSPRELALVRQLQQQIASNKGAKGRRALHHSVTGHQQALLELTTKRFHIKIDDMGNGKLRYASWPIGKKMSEKPDLILSNGRVFNGIGRNQRFIFDNGTYSYQLKINPSRQNVKTTGLLEVYKGGQTWLREVATDVIRR